MPYKKITYKRNGLYDQVWSEPMTKLAPKYGLSDNGLRKICKKLNIPLPPIGYWAKLQYGKAASRPSLPPAKKNEYTVERWIADIPELDETEKTEVQKIIDLIEGAENLIQVSDKLRNSHPYVKQTQDALKDAGQTEYGILLNWPVKYLDISVSKNQLGRALRIMDAVIKSLEKKDYPVTMGGHQDETYVTIFGEKIRFGIREPSNQRDRAPTAEEKSNHERYPSLYRGKWTEFIPCGRLSLLIKEYPDGIRKTWSDGKKQDIENCLNDFLIGLIRVAEQKRARTIERERKAEEKREWERQRDEKIILIKEEEARIKKLEKDAMNWNKSRQIREYLVTLKKDTINKQSERGGDSDLEKWFKWAEQQADRLDPLVKSPPSILDEKEKSCI